MAYPSTQPIQRQLRPDGHSGVFAWRHTATLRTSDQKALVHRCGFGDNGRVCHGGRYLPHPLSTPVLVLILATGAATAACSTAQNRIQHHQEKFRSLASTADTIGNAWLGGTVSGTYASTALEQTFLLVEQERRGLASAPRTLSDPVGAQLADAADQLARVIALLKQQIAAADVAAVRQHLSQIPLRPAPSS
jgi:hypothetical protein